MNKQSLIDTAMLKYPKARKIAVENFTMGYDSLSMEAGMNLSADTRAYGWKAPTVNAIRFVLRGGR